MRSSLVFELSIFESQHAATQQVAPGFDQAARLSKAKNTACHAQPMLFRPETVLTFQLSAAWNFFWSFAQKQVAFLPFFADIIVTRVETQGGEGAGGSLLIRAGTRRDFRSGWGGKARFAAKNDW